MLSLRITNYWALYRSAYEEEILETIVIPTFANIAYENDAKIRTSVGELLLKFAAQCDTKRSIELLDIVEKLLNRPFDLFTDDSRIILKNDEELNHITMIIDELIRVSQKTLNQLCTAVGVEYPDFNRYFHLPGIPIEALHFANRACHKTVHDAECTFGKILSKANVP